MPFEWISRAFLLLLPLLIVELGLRIFYHPAKPGVGDWHFEYDPDKSYRWKADLRGVFESLPFTTNAEHRIGRVYPPEKEGPRIALIGDSVSFGAHVPQQSSFGALLEKELSAELLNYAVPGYSPFQYYYDLQASMLQCPDLVLLQLQANDLVEPFHYLRRLGGVGVDYHRVPDPGGLHFLFRGQLRMYDLVSDLISGNRMQSFGDEEQKALAARQELYKARLVLEHPEFPASQEAWKEFDYWISGMGAVCRLQKVPCVVFLSPSSFQLLEPSNELSAGLELLHKKLANEGVVTLDPWPALEAAMKKEAKDHRAGPLARQWTLFFQDENHPNARGHEFLANFLLPEIRAQLEKHGRRTCQ